MISFPQRVALMLTIASYNSGLISCYYSRMESLLWNPISTNQHTVYSSITEPRLCYSIISTDKIFEPMTKISEDTNRSFKEEENCSLKLKLESHKSVMMHAMIQNTLNLLAENAIS